MKATRNMISKEFSPQSWLGHALTWTIFAAVATCALRPVAVDAANGE